MGWEDRPYSSGPSGPGYGGGMRLGLPAITPVVKKLLIANFAVFVLVILTGKGAGWVFRNGCMDVGAVLHGQIWRLVTYEYLHDNSNIMHILFNMLGVFFLGPPLERHWGGRKFFIFYTVAGALGALFYMLLASAGFLAAGPMIGASGCVLGILGACAVLFPQFTIIFLFFPVPIRFAAVLLSAIYVLNILSRGFNAGGDAAHLAGLVFGVLWPLYGQRLWSRYRVVRQHSAWERRQRSARHEQEEMDRILRKVHQQGINALSGREKKFLAEATKRQQDRDRRAGLHRPL
jgi:membrane associated rhomboid family serine protease